VNRRTFLLTGAAAIAAASVSKAQMPHWMKHMQGSHGAVVGSRDVPQLLEGEPLCDLPRLANESGKAGLFEARLTAEPGLARFANDHETPVLAYNGEAPGPLIEVTEGDRVNITFRNRIPGEVSTIHWHGIPVPADQDGNPMDPVTSGSERIYAFDLPEGSAGSYWYHPHAHGLTAAQVHRGLAGAFIIKPKSDPIPASYGDTVLFFTDLRLGSDGTIPPSTMCDMMNGRVGDNVLVNGQKNPTLQVPAGTHRRFRLFNATNARYLHLTFGGAPLSVIGTDGGLLEAPVHGLDRILLVPGERLEVVAAFDHPGEITLQTLDYGRGWMGPGKPREAGLTLLTINVTNEAAIAPPPLSRKLRAIPDLGTPIVKRRFVLGEGMRVGTTGMGVAFLINGVPFDMHRIDVVSNIGAVELWEIHNPTHMDHPFHVHGTQFQLVEKERAGKLSKAGYRAWKDTVNVAQGETVRIKIRQDSAGQRMFHCHILEHEDLGMMGIAEIRTET
jgi:FtsP/CotA-like multicopper oxidase with cupredoxin domain